MLTLLFGLVFSTQLMTVDAANHVAAQQIYHTAQVCPATQFALQQTYQRA